MMQVHSDDDVMDFTPREPSDKPKSLTYLAVSFLLGLSIGAYVVYQIMKG